MAKERGESVNTIAGRALLRLVEWDPIARRIGLVVVSAVTLEKLMDSLTLEQARALGESTAGDVLKPMILSHHGKATMATALESIELISRYLGRFDFDSALEGSKRVVTIRHSKGAKWSAFYAGATMTLFSSLDLFAKMSETEEHYASAMEAVFEDFLGKRHVETISDNVSVVEFKK